MKKLFDYLHSIFNLTIREYKNEKLQLIVGNVYSPDIVTPHLPRILEIRKSIAQIMTGSLHCYGIIRSDDLAYVIGPVVRMPPDDVELKELALELRIAAEEVTSLRAYLDSLPIISLTKFADILCMVNSVLNKEDVQPENILLNDPELTELDEEIPPAEDISLHNYLTEKKLMGLIARGDVYALKEYMMNTQFRQDFNIANDSIRNVRNILIVAATLETRAAIEGGLAPTKAFDLSDMYIRTAETLTRPGDIYALMPQMVLDFAKRVGACMTPENASSAVASCLRWIRRNINQPISLADAANQANMSCGYFSTLFKKQVGMSFSDYLASQRIEEAKRLLATTDKPLADIAAYLCFSSQSYFQNVFKKHSQMTPTAYRKSMEKLK